MTVAQMFHAFEPPENTGTRRKMGVEAGEALHRRRQQQRQECIDGMMGR